MTLQQLRCFAEVAKYRSFARAAEQLFVSQPAVSHHIRSLEAELGVTLIERTLRHVALTPAGEKFYLETVDMLRHLEAAVSNVRGNTIVPETLHIGFESTVQIHRLPDIFRAYSEACPDVCLYSHELSLGSQEQMFRDGRVDVMFTSIFSSRMPDAEYCPLFEGRFCCVTPPEHPLAQRSMLRAQDLQRETMIFLDNPNCPAEMENIQRDIRMKCFGATLYYSTSSLYTIPMIEAGLGVAVMPEFVVPRGAKVVRIPFESGVRSSHGIAWHKSGAGEKVLRFVRVAKACYGVK